MKITCSLLILLLTFSFASFVGATNLPRDEVQALKDIAKTLGKEDWNFQADPCHDWTTPNPESGKENAVSCNCSTGNDGFCHVVSIVLRRQSLPGKLPPELVRLPYLQEIDLNRNYLDGTIPPNWGSLKLVNISLPGNRLTGQIPRELGNISTLKILDLRFNQLSGSLPPELGNLTHLERLALSSNNFTGELPPEFAKLTALNSFVLLDNQFSGKIPNFIGSWTSLKKLVIQGCGLSGPIPDEISSLENLTLLWISDLNGSDSKFPPLSNLINIEKLILRSCNIRGKLPEYLGYMTQLEMLDLSFNKLQGTIPSTLGRLNSLENLYLTGNLLYGPVPDLSEKVQNIDLSYNKFNPKILGHEGCQQGKVNLFGNSLMADNSGSVDCIKSFGCPKVLYSLHINCGGDQANIGGTIYDDDLDLSGPARFVKGTTNWASSNTGQFVEIFSIYNYIAANKYNFPVPKLYENARFSPSSLTYYGFCLGNGQYTVNLHFAEIMFTNNKSYSSLGRRVFDVYIQGKLRLKDFNIANEAGGVGKPIIRNFAVNVTSTTLEIRFYWAGKGTAAIPESSMYGPLISAISINPDFKPPKETRSIPTKVVAAIVATGVIIVILTLGMFWWRGSIGKKGSLAIELKDLNLQTGLFNLCQIKAATNNFDISNKIGEGGFGPVYKGFLSDGSIIAVKQLSSKSKQGNREFINEIGIISALQHPCLVKLYGCCVEGDQLLLVYEYMENNSLARALFGPEECRLKLDWPTRQKICVDVARGLAFLHEESRLKIVHRDIKATNVLLDKHLNAKISDFGLAKLDEEENTHISTRIAGTYGYMAPEYAMHGYLTDKADVYSFGIIALEIVSGRSNTIHRQGEDCFDLFNWAHVLKANGSLMELVDRRLGSDFDKEEVMVMINVAFLCTNSSSSLRPTMSSVVSMLEARIAVPELISDQSEESNKMKLKAMRHYYQEIEENQISDTDFHTKNLLGQSTFYQHQL